MNNQHYAAICLIAGFLGFCGVLFLVHPLLGAGVFFFALFSAGWLYPYK